MKIQRVLPVLATVLILSSCAFISPPELPPSPSMIGTGGEPSGGGPSVTDTGNKPSGGISSIRERILRPAEEKISQDFDVSGQIGTIVNKPEIVQCSAYLKGIVDNLGAANDQSSRVKSLQLIDHIVGSA